VDPNRETRPSGTHAGEGSSIWFLLIPVAVVFVPVAVIYLLNALFGAGL
jgi:hypothetical protein